MYTVLGVSVLYGSIMIYSLFSALCVKVEGKFTRYLSGNFGVMLFNMLIGILFFVLLITALTYNSPLILFVFLLLIPLTINNSPIILFHLYDRKYFKTEKSIVLQWIEYNKLNKKEDF